MIFALALAAAITVGDPVTIDLPRAPVVLQKSADYEILSNAGKRIVVRTFQAKPFVVAGLAGGEPFRRVVEVQSVLQPDDALTPAPLAPPRVAGEPKLPWIFVASAALLAIASWTWLALRARRVRTPVVVAPPLTPMSRFVATVERLRGEPDTPQRWAQLADALRDYLAATRELSPDLTTTELLTLTHDGVIADVLHQGDLEKFSPWGAGGADFDDVARRALELAA
jgi:hypothetical protein